MNYGGFKGRNSVFAFLLFSALLLFSMSVWASQEELDEVRNAIESKGAHWVAGETSISILSPEERRARLGAEKPLLTGLEVFAPVEVFSAPPPSLDWRNYNGYMFITPVRNQGNCGSCWAFATTAALESYVLITQNTPGADVNLSEQTLVSCSGAGSCSGGSAGAATNYIMNTGLPAEDCFRYTAANTSCSNACSGYQTNTYRIHDSYWVSPNVSAIKTALYTYGPLVTTMDVYSDFFSYRTGIYTYVAGPLNTYQGGHAILLVGYDDGGGYFVAKNSWGTGWGEAGYFKIAYSELGSVVQFGHYTIAYDSPPISISTASAPSVAWNPTAGKYHVAIRRADNKIYIGTANVDGVLNFDFAPLASGFTSAAPGIAWDPLHQKLIIAVKGLNLNNLWLASMNADGSGFSGFTIVGVGNTAAPSIAWNPNTNMLQYAILVTNAVWIGSVNFNGTVFSSPAQLQLAGAVGSAPAIAIATTGTFAGKVQLAVKSTGTQVLVGNVNANGTLFSGWKTMPTGSIAFAPSVAWNPTTSKLDIAVKGSSKNTLWKGATNGDSLTGYVAFTQVAGAVSTNSPAAGINPLLAPLNIFTVNGGNISGYVTAGL